eukprot:IDg14913t1
MKSWYDAFYNEGDDDQAVSMGVSGRHPPALRIITGKLFRGQLCLCRNVARDFDGGLSKLLKGYFGESPKNK